MGPSFHWTDYARDIWDIYSPCVKLFELWRYDCHSYWMLLLLFAEQVVKFTNSCWHTSPRMSQSWTHRTSSACSGTSQFRSSWSLKTRCPSCLASLSEGSFMVNFSLSGHEFSFTCTRLEIALSRFNRPLALLPPLISLAWWSTAVLLFDMIGEYWRKIKLFETFDRVWDEEQHRA